MLFCFFFVNYLSLNFMFGNRFKIHICDVKNLVERFLHFVRVYLHVQRKKNMQTFLNLQYSIIP